MGEGLVDNRKTESKYWLLIEDVSQIRKSEKVQQKRFDNSDDMFDKGDVIRSFNVPTEPAETYKPETFSRPSLYANQMSNLLNYPVGIFIVDPEHQSSVNHSIRLMNKQFPCDVHLLTLRTQADTVYSQFPSSSALMVLHRQGYDCAINSNYTCDVHKFDRDINFEFLSVRDIDLKSLSGIETLYNLKNLGDIYMDPMSLKTLNVTFG